MNYSSSITQRDRWKSSPNFLKPSSVNSYRKLNKLAENQVKGLTSRIAFINRHFHQIEKQKIKLQHTSSLQKLTHNTQPTEQKHISPMVRNFMLAQEVKQMKLKNSNLLSRNKENTKLSNLVKRHNINMHKQNKKDSIIRFQQSKQQNANNFREQKFKKLMQSQRLQQKLRTQLIMEQSIALQRLDHLIKQQGKIKQQYKQEHKASTFYITQLN